MFETKHAVVNFFHSAFNNAECGHKMGILIGILSNAIPLEFLLNLQLLKYFFAFFQKQKKLSTNVLFDCEPLNSNIELSFSNPPTAHFLTNSL